MFLDAQNLVWECPDAEERFHGNVSRLYTFHGDRDKYGLELSNLLKDTSKVIRMRGNARLPFDKTRDIFRLLFKPSRTLVRDATRLISTTVDSRRYAGVHIRMGDAANGSAVYTYPWFANDHRLTKENVQNIIDRVRRKHRLLWVATDNFALRQEIAQGAFHNVVVWNYSMHDHSAMQNPHSLRHMKVSFLEAMIMGSGSCLVPGIKTDARGGVGNSWQTASGFSVVSHLLTGVPMCKI
tara:strand:- start:1323 stop:2039 length:717 start_codon:yes stop_codon:yes gene_type:complete